ncbi:GH36 C-terminal domain-containing protein [Lactobacillus gallinarum]|uniref:GH36 C-terminal domain-containing protein n=1 Tax=Lactobacillus gallinarum TaxID=52242 RepID=UPI00248E6CEC|nr:GH36 C-terminal domain-containing protein [Lactobacillus gallinarum]
MPLEDQNKYAWSVKQDEKQIISFFRKLAKPNDTLDRYLSLSNLDQNADYIINQKNKVSGRVLTNFGLREPYQFNASNGDTAQVTGDFQSYLFEIEKG